MSLKKICLIAVCTFASANSLDGRITTNTKLMALGAVLSAAGLSAAQHKFSRLAHERYPLMQRKNILNATLAKEKRPEMIEAATAELATVNQQLECLHTTRNDYRLLRIALSLLSLIAGAGAAHEWYTTPEDTEPNGASKPK